MWLLIVPAGMADIRDKLERPSDNYKLLEEWECYDVSIPLNEVYLQAFGDEKHIQAIYLDAYRATKKYKKQVREKRARAKNRGQTEISFPDMGRIAGGRQQVIHAYFRYEGLVEQVLVWEFSEGNGLFAIHPGLQQGRYHDSSWRHDLKNSVKGKFNCFDLQKNLNLTD